MVEKKQFNKIRKAKKILILGLGKEGLDTLKFLKKIFPEKEIGIADKDENCRLKIADCKFRKIKWHLGKDYLKTLKNYDLVIKSPGIPIHLLEVEKAFQKGKITSQTEIFFENCPGKIVGITGTKGKSTTTFLIYKVLKLGGIKAKLVGNIGRPVLNFLPSARNDDVFVCELSSHQLYNLKKSPQVAVFLNIFPEHLDYYRNFKEYLMAKANICRWQTKNDFLIYNFKDKCVRKIAQLSKAKKIPLRNCQKLIKEIGIKKFPFFGNFYQLNVAAAIKVGKIFGIKKEKIKKAIETLKPLSHRLEYIGKYKEIEFYNDSLSTIPETTIAALKALGNKVETLLLGGFDRGVSFKNLIKEIFKRKIKNLILFPKSGDRIGREILNSPKNKKKLMKIILVQNMKDAVKLAFKLTKIGRICLLSPASPSFGLFKNYKERGNLFKKYVKYYGKTI